MGFLHRRLPFRIRPVPFFGFLGGTLLTLWAGLGWRLDWSLQTGNVFLLVLVPQSLVAGNPARWVALLASAASIVALCRWGVERERVRRAWDAEGLAWWARGSFRFYPLTLLFGLFVLYHGLLILFDASVYGDQAPGGYAAFLYLDYAGLLDRPVLTVLGLIVAGVGISCTTFLAFDRGIEDERLPWRRVPIEAEAGATGRTP